MQIIPKDKVIFDFNKENNFNYSIEDGEIFYVETEDCYNGQIKNENIKRQNIDISIMDCSVGPIEVKGAKEGDVLEIEVLDIELAKQGVMVTSPGLGILGHKIIEADTKIIKIEDGFAYFSDQIKIPLTPMIGVIGVFPKKEGIHCAIPKEHGANMDTKVIKKGTKVFLPVFVNGAGLAIGDLHACMGDGELSGTGIEIAGKVCLKVKIRKEMYLERPMLETKEGIYTIGSAETFREAIKLAVDDMVLFLMKKLNLNFPDAYRLLSATCDVQISQIVNDLITVRVMAPKFHLNIQSLIKDSK
ncbi:acetamidase/formamidase family protein [Fusobacterium sp.]|uniref:acetamidase/formamidase family protein n=1 Tax=Fusobacterium sp. TaxID=68766 RepID=UPI0025F8B191|nr:acetamidase/formamidase family protein [Fusobacterium sp.]MDY3060491.1 acetamidase/formamidase family protein [Fusobacterium sp.]